MDKKELLKLKKEQLANMLLDEIKKSEPTDVKFECAKPDFESEYYKLMEFRQKYRDLLEVLGRREIEILSLEKHINSMYADIHEKDMTIYELREKLESVTEGK